MWLEWLMAATLAAGSAQPTPRFLALGDSYTIGEGVAADDNWPRQLAAALRAHGLSIADPEIVARTGWTTDELSAALDGHRFDPPYALVTLSIGVNNQYRGRSVAEYAEQFSALLHRAIALAGGDARRVVVVSIPDWGVTRFGVESGRDRAAVAAQLDDFNAANARICAALHVARADVAPASRQAGAQAASLVADGLHPSAAAYRQWLQVIEPLARRALGG